MYLVEQVTGLEPAKVISDYDIFYNLALEARFVTPALFNYLVSPTNIVQ
jgi:hypothetical protein